MEENAIENKNSSSQNDSQKQIAGAIVLAGIIIAGAIFLKGGQTPSAQNAAITGNTNTGTTAGTTLATIAKVSAADRTIGNPQAKVTLVLYEDFQCPFCGKFFKESEQNIRDTYVKDGNVQFVYRDFAFLGESAAQNGREDESTKAAEAARCAGDQNQFWQYHDYLFNHQNGEDQGAFSVTNLKTFAKTLGLDTTSFNQCMDADKYAQAVADSKAEAANAGVSSTPKGFILRDGKTIDTIDGAIPFDQVKQKIDNALK